MKPRKMTSAALALVLSAVFTVVGVAFVPGMLRLMSTPEDVMEGATLYLRIYFAGVSGLMLYNIGSGILRAVGDSTRPLYFLIFSAVTNTALDLLFVIVLRLSFQAFKESGRWNIELLLETCREI